VRRVARRQREAREQREADDDPARHVGQAAPLLARGQRRADGREVGDGQQRSDGRPAERDEPRVEVGDRELGRRQRERERDDADEPRSNPVREASVELFDSWVEEVDARCVFAAVR
jgi:hypothetical protein